MHIWFSAKRDCVFVCEGSVNQLNTKGGPGGWAVGEGEGGSERHRTRCDVIHIGLWIDAVLPNCCYFFACYVRRPFCCRSCYLSICCCMMYRREFIELLTEATTNRLSVVAKAAKHEKRTRRYCWPIGTKKRAILMQYDDDYQYTLGWLVAWQKVTVK